MTQNDVNQTVPFDAGVIPCANGGAGEDVSGTIDLHTLITTNVRDRAVPLFKPIFRPILSLLDTLQPNWPLLCSH